MSEYRYRLSSTGYNSNRYGNCEVCGKYVTEVFIQTKTKHYKFEHNGVVYEGWSHQGDAFGHEKCLLM